MQEARGTLKWKERLNVLVELKRNIHFDFKEDYKQYISVFQRIQSRKKVSIKSSSSMKQGVTTRSYIDKWILIKLNENWETAKREFSFSYYVVLAYGDVDPVEASMTYICECYWEEMVQ